MRTESSNINPSYLHSLIKSIDLYFFWIIFINIWAGTMAQDCPLCLYRLRTYYVTFIKLTQWMIAKVLHVYYDVIFSVQVQCQKTRQELKVLRTFRDNAYEAVTFKNVVKNLGIGFLTPEKVIKNDISQSDYQKEESKFFVRLNCDLWLLRLPWSTERPKLIKLDVLTSIGLIRVCSNFQMKIWKYW